MTAGARPKRPIPSMTAEAAVEAVVGYLNANPDVLGGLKRKGKRSHLVELRRAVDHSVPSSSSARCASPLRVRVFTVPSGTWRKSAISLWERPEK